MNLKELRILHNLSQEELADLARISPGTIRNYENGYSIRVDMRNIHNIAKTLGTDITEIYRAIHNSKFSRAGKKNIRVSRYR